MISLPVKPVSGFSREWEVLVSEKKRKKKKDGSQSISNGNAVVSVTAERGCRKGQGAPGGLVRCFARTPFSTVVPCGGEWAVPRGAVLGCHGCNAAIQESSTDTCRQRNIMQKFTFMCPWRKKRFLKKNKKKKHCGCCNFIEIWKNCVAYLQALNRTADSRKINRVITCEPVKALFVLN